MSIKKLFEAADKSRNYLAETNEKNAFEDVESSKNIEQIAIKKQTFVPNIDYSNPENFAKFGSAYYYYSGAIGRLIDYYPYDGSDAEQNEFYNRSLDVEKYIFNNLFPRVNGYANFNSSSYIDLKGGPHGVTYSKVADLFDNPLDSKRHAANVYDTNIYRSAGLPDSYGTGSRESNLRANFESGVTVEFWLKSRFLAAGANQVVFDMWNNNASGTVDVGRLTIETLSASSGTPFRYTVQSGSMTSGTPGSGTIFQQSVGQSVTSQTLSDWNHYAFVFQNSGSSFVTKFYLNGYLNDTSIQTDLAIGSFDAKDMIARVGGLVTRPFKPDGTTTHIPAANAHTLTGSIDELRYWKVARNSKDIGSNWFGQVRGGTNTDISNTTLGVYYKFNEGVSGYGYLDSNVLDYSGRLSNGTWTGTPSRTLSSAIVEASAAAAEYKDPIIYSEHPEVVDLRNGLFSSGSFHDKNNTSNLKTLMPSWIIEEHESIGNKNPELIAHIVGSYFDKIYNQIEALPTFKQLQFTSASAVPLPFAEHLPQSLGLYTPQLFVDSDVISRFLNKTSDFAFEGDLTETKNLIYLNLYNNLANIYKTKGTEKSIRNVFRCFNLNDSIINLKTYLDNNVYELDQRLPRLKQVLTNKKALFFNTSSHINASCYQFKDVDDTTGTRGFISGSGDVGNEHAYGFTAEADFTLPTFNTDYDSVNRNFNQVSIFGAYTASSAPESSDTLTWPAYDGGNFQVYVVREEKFSKNVFFMLSSSYRPNEPGGDTPWENPNAGPLPILTSSVYFDAYDNTDWNVSVRLKPSTFPLAETVSGSDINYNYDLIFQGLNSKLGVIENSFTLTASLTKQQGHDFLSGSKRLYAGANRTNFTGPANYPSDVRMFNLRYWAKFIDDDSLKQHIYDFDNSGISGSFKNISPLDPNNDGYDIKNRNMLVLDWNFSDVTASDGSGNFLTQDMSSGSAQIRRGYGWVGELAGYKHPGKGDGFKANSTSVSKDFNINTFKFIDPESPISSDMVKILSADDEVFGFPETVPNFHHKLEKSMYAAVSDEMLNFFAGVIDFNNIVGEPVNRYRGRYKQLEKLREAFFRRVTKTSHVEDYIKYYQWFDDSLSYIIGQLVPVSNKFSEDVLNIVESHALERNKYKSQFPTIEFKLDDPMTPMLGINERLYNWKYNHAPLSMSLEDAPDGPIPGVGGPLTGSEMQQVNSKWWQQRAERFESHISSDNNLIDQQRDIIRKSNENDNNQKLNILVTLTNGVHSGSSYVLRKLTKPYKLTAYRTASPVMPVKGGVNFEQTKKIDLTYNALRPAGPINNEGGVYVPENVLFANIFDSTLGEELDIVKLKDSTDPRYDPWFVSNPNAKIHRHAKVQHGRDWEYGMGYKSIKSDFAFPFNIISSSVNTGYNRLVQFRAMSGVMITNLHNDVYGPDMESPMQGPFTNYAVGGHQSRHVRLNTAGSPAVGSVVIADADSIVNGDTITLGGVTFTWTTSSPSLDTEIKILTTGGSLAIRNLQNASSLAAKINEYFTNPTMVARSPDAAYTTTSTVSITYNAGSTADTIATSNTTAFTVSGFTGGEKGPGNLDDWRSRPEAWKILLGKCDDPLVRGAIGMVGPDYPQPNASGTLVPSAPYPSTASQKAVYYRDFVARSPVNIRNILHTTGSTILGNYEHNYQVVQAPGGRSNPRQFLEKQPNLPTTIFSGFFGPGQPSQSQATSVRTLLDIYRSAVNGVYNAETASVPLGTTHLSGHFDFSADYNTDYLQGGLGYYDPATNQPRVPYTGGVATINNSVITSKFSAPGGIEIMTKGYQDFRSGEFSVYNMLNNRNLTVKRPFQSHPLVSGAAESDGIRVYDIHGNDYGHTVHAARHTERFFRDSILVPNNQGATYAEKPAFHRVHRNNIPRPKLLSENYLSVLSGSQNNNNQACYFIEPQNYSSMLLSNETNGDAANGVASRFLSASRPSGFTYSGWIRLDPSTTRDNNGNAYLFGVGKAAGSSEPFIEISKTSASFAVEIQSRNATKFQGSSRRAEWNISTVGDNNATAQVDQLNLGNWVHLAVSVPVSAAYPGPAAPSVYINGVAQPVSEDTSPYNYWDPKQDTGTTNILGAVPRDGTSSFAFGRNPAKVASGLAQFGTSGAMDQISIWTTALSASEVTELYNGGIPCDVTSSQAYQNSASHLFAWYKMGEGSPHGNADSVNTTNTKAFNSSSNAIYNFVRDEHHLFALSNNQQNNQGIVLTTGENGGTPSPLQGCQPTTIGYSASLVYNTCGQVYDNLNVYHQIPRSDRQYAWMTGAMLHTDPCNLRYAGFMPIFGHHAGLSGSEPWLTMISSSEIGVFNHAAFLPTPIALGAIAGGSEQDQRVEYFIPQDFAGINTLIYEPITSSTNTLGWPHNVPMFSVDNTDPHQYRNKSLVGYVNTIRGAVSSSMTGAKNQTDGLAPALLFNSLMLKRNGPYGYGTHAQHRRNSNHPVLRNERSSSEISVITRVERNPVRPIIFDGGPMGPTTVMVTDFDTVVNTYDVTNFTLPPVSMRGRPAILSYTPYFDVDTCGDFIPPPPEPEVLKITDNNEKVFFNSYGLNTHAGIDEYNILTPLDYTIATLYREPGETAEMDPIYLIYSENIFPSQRMEFVSSSRRRTNYDNLFWRDIREERDTLGLTFRNSVGADVSQSSWPLDPMSDFLNRTSSEFNYNNFPFVAGTPTNGTRGQGKVGMRSSKGAGELQNVYTQFYYDADRIANPDTIATWLTAQYQLAPGALYARKHMIPSCQSMVGKSGISMSQVPAGRDDDLTGYTTNNVKAYMRETIAINAGEALWEAGQHAGIIEHTFDGNRTFKSFKSEPWYDNYQDFREDIRLLAKDYAILPEFRIHNHVERYLQGINTPIANTLYEIPGTGIISTTSSFFRDYTNSERLKYFDDIDEKIKFDYMHAEGIPMTEALVTMNDRMTPKEIMITVHAVKKFNPYKGFYPAQRTLDLSSQFSKVYFPNISSKLGYYDSTGFQVSELEDRSNTLDYITRPITQATFAPGIMFNSIKSGMAVDYPVLFPEINKVNQARLFAISQDRGGSLISGVGNACPAEGAAYVVSAYTLASGWTIGKADGSEWLSSQPYFDLRLPFETMLQPGKFLKGVEIADFEPHPSCSLPYTASLQNDSDDKSYELMARNFFGETANFFLQNRDYTAFASSKIQSSGVPIISGSMYGMRIKLRRSMNKTRDYSFNFDRMGYRYAINNCGGTSGRSIQQSAAYGFTGGRKLLSNSGTIDGTGLLWGANTYEIPQDPKTHADLQRHTNKVQARENFTLYSRPSAFGPPIAVYADAIADGYQNTLRHISGSLSGAMDCFQGYNWPYTPPYYHGEAWVDLLFYPGETKNYSVEEILQSIKPIYWRVDPGPEIFFGSVVTASTHQAGTPAYKSAPALVWDNHTADGYDGVQYLGGGRTVNGIAMQISASINLFGIHKEPFAATDKLNNLLETRNENKSARWVIKPKWETPMMNFNNEGLHAVTPDSGTLTLPTYGSASVPRGMWHQFGMVESDPQKGIFLEIGDIPKSWLAAHYDVVNNPSVYNKGNPGIVTDPQSTGNTLAGQMQSLNNIFGFTEQSKKLGQLAEKTTVYEGVVVIPYYVKDYDSELITHPETVDDINLQYNKHFIEIEREKVQAAIRANLGYPMSDSLSLAGESVRKLVSKMDNYILPPEFDFIRNPDTTPIVMYIFEFGREFDKDDLSYIWQNLAPRDYKRIYFEEQSIAHKLADNELLSHDVIFNEEFEDRGALRFMAFKVKQKAVGDYYSHVLEQVPQLNSTDISGLQMITPGMFTNTRFQGLGFPLGKPDSPPVSFAPGAANPSANNPNPEFGVLTPKFEPEGLLSKPPQQEYEVQYNWPYDYLSIVEGVKIDVTVLWDDSSNREMSLIRNDLVMPTPGGGTAGTAGGGFVGVTGADPIVVESATGTGTSGAEAVLDLLGSGNSSSGVGELTKTQGTLMTGMIEKKF